MNKTLYLKLNQISEIHEKRVYLKDIAEIYSDDPALMAKCLALKIRTVPDDHNGRYVDSVITVLEKIYELDPQIQINNLGETDFIIDFQKAQTAPLSKRLVKNCSRLPDQLLRRGICHYDL